MISVATSLLFIILLFLSGKLFECVKYILKLVATTGLKLLNSIGIKVELKEPRIKTSRAFKKTFQEIKVVRKSKNNIKIKPSINISALVILICAVGLIILNLDAVSGNVVTNWLFEINPLSFLIASAEDMNVMFTAIMFSMVSFSLSKLLSQWKETKKYREAKKDIKLKNYVINKTSTKELLDSLKKRDQQKYEEVKEASSSNDRNKK